MIIIEQIPSLKIASLAYTLQKCHTDVKYWNSNNKSFFDMVYELNPQLILMTNVKEEYISSNYKLISFNPTTITQSIDLDQEWVDIIQFGMGKYNEQLKSRFLFISNKPIIDENLYNLLLKLDSSTQVKFVGNYPIAATGYVGQVSLQELNDFITSSEFVICHDNELMMESVFNGAKPIATKLNNLYIPLLQEIKNFNNIDYQLNLFKSLEDKIFNKTYLHLAHELNFSFDLYQPLSLLEQIKNDKIRTFI